MNSATAITRTRAFTLIELLIVVGIIAILAAIAIPNFLQAQARSKAARAKADIRTVATALEAYSVDNLNHYPTDKPRSDLDGFFFAPQITTPVAYLTSLNTAIDPFRRDLDLVPADADESYRYWNLLQRKSDTPTDVAVANGFQADGAWIVSSAGPDRRDNYPPSGDPHQYETFVYDPTNGTISPGDIVRTHLSGQK